MLKETGIVKNRRTKSHNIFISHIAEDFTSVDPMLKPSEYVHFCWERYKEYKRVNPYSNTNAENSMNGSIFELIIRSELYRQSMCPMYIEAQVAFVPNVKFDVLLYTSGQFPIGISLKTSLRERYKQADLEAMALKYVHRKAKNYLVLLDDNEAKIAKKRVEDGEMLGIDQVIVATSDDFDVLIENLEEMDFIKAQTIDIISTKHIVEKP